MKRARIIVVVGIVAVVLSATWLVKYRQPFQPAVLISQNSATLEANHLLVRVGKHVQDGVQGYKFNTETWHAEQSDTRSAVTVPSYDFKMYSASLPHLAIVTTRGIEAVLSHEDPEQPIDDVYTLTLRTFLADHGFRESGPPPRLDQNPIVTTLARDDMTCRISKDTYYAVIDAVCTSPRIEQETAAALQPFVKQYGAARGLSTTDITAGPLTIRSKSHGGPITASASAGYDIAELLVKPKTADRPLVALFYAKGDSWHFITDAHDEFGFSCAPIMKNAEARKALYDQVCLDEQQGHIRVDSNRRALQ